VSLFQLLVCTKVSLYICVLCPVKEDHQNIIAQMSCWPDSEGLATTYISHYSSLSFLATSLPTKAVFHAKVTPILSWLLFSKICHLPPNVPWPRVEKTETSLQLLHIWKQSLSRDNKKDHSVCSEKSTCSAHESPSSCSAFWLFNILLRHLHEKILSRYA
jgi:hypothetical protein